MVKTFKEAFKVTIPVLLGYLSIGLAFGLMMQSIGLNFVWAGGRSLVIYAGTLQYLAVMMFQTGMSMISVALMTLFVHFRHMVYGLSLIEKFKDISFFKKVYMIFGLTDETYALLTSSTVPESVKDDVENYYFYIYIRPFLLDYRFNPWGNHRFTYKYKHRRCIFCHDSIILRSLHRTMV